MAEKEKKNNVVPQEYVDKMQEFDVEAWRKQRIADALRNHEERQEPYGGDLPPAWMGKKLNLTKMVMQRLVEAIHLRSG